MILILLKDKFRKAMLLAYPEIADENFAVDIVAASQDKFGHYQFNSAMKLAKLLKSNPREVAEKIKAHVAIEDINGLRVIDKLEIAGPGFINISLDREFIAKKIHAVLVAEDLGIAKNDKSKKIIIDFSGPNTAKEMHVGHLRSTIIGDSIANLFEFLGYDVLRLNHIGDWGTAFGMLIAYMKANVPQVLEGKEATDLTHLAKWYKESKGLFDEDPNFKKKSQVEVVELQSGNLESLKAWKIICDISRKAYQEIYDLLGVSLIERGESFYNPMLAPVVADLEAKGLITVSDGAKCIFMEGFTNREGNPLPFMVQKSDGGYNYDTTDIASIRHRIEEEKGDRLIYVTDAGQSRHFQMLFAAAKRAKYWDPKKLRIDHVPFGLVLGNDGKKFRSRSGETEKLIDLITTAIDKAEDIVTQRTPDLDKKSSKELARALGISAIKYADLSCNRVGDYVFSYDKMLKFEGNTAAYLLYSYVRIASIKRKVGCDIENVQKSSKIDLQHPSEVALGLYVLQFEDVLRQFENDLLPNVLTEYLYGLAEKFNAFFRDCRVEGSPEQNSRLLLCESVARTLKLGLAILGVKTVEKM